MNWFRQNRFLGVFLGALALAIALSVYFLLHEKDAAEEAGARLDTTVTELNRLRGSAPFPSEENLRKTKLQTDNYRNSLLALEMELKNRMFPKPPLQPNEFQALLRQATTAVADRARASKVQLPENFNLGFDEYATSLPNSLAAPRLGRQLHAIEWIADTVIDSHVDALLSLTRSALPEEKAAPASTPAPGRTAQKAKTAEPNTKIVDSTSVDISFASSPAAARRIFNQIAAAKEQTYIIRTLQVHNQADKGPKRGGTGDATSTPTPAPRPGGTAKPGDAGISFIVGTEHVNVAARIEILRFNIPEKEAR
ncbi:MAG TPA: Amuc_1100 family pilus-like protein [Chthoniobacterales bacterium]